ncbi:MAG: trypsin [Actinomycetia bacterium]|nr:trypsin [Actinomycetes bacterium]
MGMRKRLRVRVALVGMAVAVAGVVALPNASGAATSNATPRIVGGGPVGKTQFPSLAALMIPGKGHPRERLVCSGTVVAPDVILSAGHCMFPILFGLAMQGQTGSRDLGDKAATVASVTSVVLNKTWWFGSQSDDLALFKLSAPVPVPVSPLASKADRGLTVNGNQVQITGWGLTIPLAVFQPPPFDALPPRRAQVATVPIVGDDICQADYADLDPTIFVPATDLCAGQEGKDACYGDSGGPMYATDPSGGLKQIGVVSRGAGCATKSFPGIWTDVTALRPWIDKNVSNPCHKSLDPALAIQIYVC